MHPKKNPATWGKCNFGPVAGGAAAPDYCRLPAGGRTEWILRRKSRPLSRGLYVIERLGTTLWLLTLKGAGERRGTMSSCAPSSGFAVCLPADRKRAACRRPSSSASALPVAVPLRRCADLVRFSAAVRIFKLYHCTTCVRAIRPVVAVKVRKIKGRRVTSSFTRSRRANCNGMHNPIPRSRNPSPIGRGAN